MILLKIYFRHKYVGFNSRREVNIPRIDRDRVRDVVKYTVISYYVNFSIDKWSET